MGLLDFLFGRDGSRRVQTDPLCIWRTAEEKYSGIAGEVTSRIASGAQVILVLAHFDDVLRELRGRLPEISQAIVRIALSSEIGPEMIDSLGIDESTLVEIIVAERHPRLSVDESIEQFAESLPCGSRLSSHVSLEDPLLKIYGGEQIQQMLSMLGMQPGEKIESEMVARRIRAAQQKIEAEAFGDSPASSAEDWLEKNHP